MKNREQWVPTKFIRGKDGFQVSMNERMVGLGSRFIAGIQLRCCETALRDHARGVLLDMGCGAVPLYEVYRGYVQDAVCVDWEQSWHPNSFIDQIVDLNRPLPLPSDAYDTVLLTDVLEHVAEPGALVGEIARILKEDGKAIITVPFFYWLHEQPHDYYRYTEFALRRLCELSRLEIISLKPYGGVPEIMLDITAKVFIRLPRPIARVVSRVHLWVSRFLLSLSVVRKISGGTAESFPLGYCLIARKAPR